MHIHSWIFFLVSLFAVELGYDCDSLLCSMCVRRANTDYVLFCLIFAQRLCLLCDVLLCIVLD